MATEKGRIIFIYNYAHHGKSQEMKSIKHEQT